MILSERLRNVIELANKGEVVADIGCDHAFVSIELVSEGLYKRAIAMDINEGPLIKAKQHISEKHLSGKIETRLSNGLDKLIEENVDTAIITGMGGPLIENILYKDIEKAKKIGRLVLGPQSDLAHFRRFLYENSFEIFHEKYIYEDGKYYSLIVCGYNPDMNKYEEDNISLYFEFGEKPLKFGDEILIDYLKEQNKQYSSIRSELSERLKNYYDEINNEKSLDDKSEKKLMNKIENMKKRIEDISNYLMLIEKALKGGIK